MILEYFEGSSGQMLFIPKGGQGTSFIKGGKGTSSKGEKETSWI